MKQGFDIHNYKRQLTTAERVVQNSTLSLRNKEIIFQFRDFCLLKGYSTSRILKYFEILQIFAKQIGKDLDKATKKDFENFADLKKRVKLMPDPETTIIKRIVSEIEGKEKHLLFIEA